MTSARYLRYPHVRGDLLTFIADDDVWLAPANGGRAWRLSADQAAAAYPRLSPDGSMVAWTSWRDGPAEIYLAATSGGGSQRATYWSSPYTVMHGWGPDGEILATTSAGQPFIRMTWAYALPVSDGTAEFAAARRLPYGPVSDLALDGGATVLLNGTGGEEPAFWKRYRGGRAGRLWVGQSGSDEGFSRVLADLGGQVFSPMLVAGRLAMISDHEGTGNLYSCALDGSDLRRHTDYDDWYVRNASTDGTRIVYQLAGDLWMLNDLAPDSEPVRLDLSLGSPASALTPRLISADDHLDDLSCDFTGRASVVSVRGTVHWLTHRDGPARALSAVPGPIASLPVVLGTTGRAAWVVEVDGADAIEIAPAAGAPDEPAIEPRRIAHGEIGWASSVAAAPDGSRLAVAAHDGGLTVADAESGQVTELARSDNGRITGLAFSPDSRWLAWSQPALGTLKRIRLASLADQQVSDVTDGRFIDTDPVFTGDGLYLAFLSKRTFDPVHDSHVFDLYFPYGSRPYLITLAAATPSPFGPFTDGRPASAGKDHDSGKSKRGSASSEESADDAHDIADVVIDLDGLGHRLVALPVPDSRYASLRAVEGGLAWLREPLNGELGEGGASPDDEQPRPALEHFDLKRVRCTELADEVNWFEASGDGTRLVVRDHHRVCVIPAHRKADSDNTDDRISVDLSRARFRAAPAALWRAAFDQAARMIRHDFWVPDLAEVDWDGVLSQYRPLLDRISTSSDFADLLHEVQGELGSSHAYVRAAAGSDHRPLTGLLGADLERGDDGWRIRRILPSESSDPRARSPLAALGAGLAAGDVISAVDGQPVDQARGPAPLLAGTAGKPVELTVVRAADGTSRRAVVVPLADERRLRYQDWVAGRRQVVRELGQGRIGYLHVPDMQSEGWSDFNRDLRGEMQQFEGLIIDVRANRGGHTSQLVIEKLVRRIIGWDLPRHGLPVSYPEESPRGPVVAVADEMSASDGDIVTASIRSLRIGQVVGTRTWGGVIGIEGWHELVDGTAITIPKFSFWFSRFGWGVENYGVDPDVEVPVSPEDWAEGRDPQLETAVRLTLESLEAQGASQPPALTDRPSRRRPPLPPRP